MDDQQSVSGKSSQSLHFSDGIVEFSDKDSQESSNIVSPNNVLLRFIDWFGEKLAWGLGISSPKYYYIIENSLSSKQDVISLGDMDDPHVAILQNPLSNDSHSRSPVTLSE
uniref:Uncharacterized protein n=1 Tax=Trichobilharzia regenti TaxID=157069 RepID=A0AA85JQW5_TRIRE|nr:unnamed protein product [Trichobilharzia regenti]